ncbi:MAG: single-stranded-DNA-specific exonuclease RecJ [Rhodospirillaceae bacterium]|nr:MAG: single-stranded-DNA-specific exonuclease RecJ [Rhodospirillaceae bacterium]
MVEPPSGENFLDVASSLSGKRWRARASDARIGMALAQRLELPEILGRVLTARGVSLEEADAFLEPTLRKLLPNPSHLKDMDVAAARLADAIRNGEAVAVFGDYDVDGATSSALLERFFRSLGASLRVYIPDRRKEGYGPTAAALQKLRNEGASLVVTVDCGATAFSALEAASAAGLDVIVVDHHIGEPRLPPALAVVNPNRLDETSPHRQLAAVGVTYLLVIAVNRCLRKAGFYATRNEPDLLQWLDLVALGTVCDVASLTGVNRAFVVQGLQFAAKRGNPGIAALADVAKVEMRPTAYHLGFALGPRVNAGGRVGEASLGARLLATEDVVEARELAAHLDVLNMERRQIEADVQEQAIAQIETAGEIGHIAFAAGADWHPGVVGIVASRLKERYGRPAFVAAIEDGRVSGSGRSVPGVDLGSAVLAARQAGLIEKGGGHAMAAGFTASVDALPELRAFLDARLGEALTRIGFVPSLGFDGVLTPAAATPEFVALLERLSPFGAGNAEPRFAFADARIVFSDIVGADHVRCTITDAQGNGRVKGISFRSADTPLGQALLDRGGLALHLAGHLRVDRWQGRESVQLFIEDVAPARPAG